MIRALTALHRFASRLQPRKSGSNEEGSGEAILTVMLFPVVDATLRLLLSAMPLGQPHYDPNLASWQRMDWIAWTALVAAYLIAWQVIGRISRRSEESAELIEVPTGLLKRYLCVLGLMSVGVALVLLEQYSLYAPIAVFIVATASAEYVFFARKA